MRSLFLIRSDNNGAAAAEMALIVPLLSILMFGSFEMGNFFWNEHRVVKAVRDGARFAGRQPFAKFACGSASLADAALETQIKNLTRTGTVDGTGAAKVYGWANTHVTVSVDCPATALNTGIYSGLANAPRVTVSTTIPYRSILQNLGFNTTGLNLRAQAQAAVMGL